MKKYIFIPLVSLLLLSCSSMLYTTIDVLKPAKMSFAPNAENILLLNNTIKQSDDYGHKDEFWNKSTRRVIMNTDSLPLFTLSALQEELAANGFFRSVNVQLASENSGNDFFTVNQPDNNRIKELCKTYNTDVVLSLNRLKVNDLIGEIYDSETTSSYFALVARYESQWSVHYPNRADKELYMFLDTIFWESEDHSRSAALAALPNRFDALVDGALYVGQNSLDRLIPYWTTADRYFFSSNKKVFKQGMDSVYVRNWQGAIAVWNAAIATDNKSINAGKLANNIAIAYEFLGDIDTALKYAVKAHELLQHDAFLSDNQFYLLCNYIDQLRVRKTEMELIKKQLSEE